MIRVDDRQRELMVRLMTLKKLPAPVTLLDIYMLGGNFHAAWLTGVEMRNGVMQNAYSESEYVAVTCTLKSLGWADLLDK